MVLSKSVFLTSGTHPESSELTSAFCSLASMAIHCSEEQQYYPIFALDWHTPTTVNTSVCIIHPVCLLRPSNETMFHNLASVRVALYVTPGNDLKITKLSLNFSSNQ